MARPLSMAKRTRQTDKAHEQPPAASSPALQILPVSSVPGPVRPPSSRLWQPRPSEPAGPPVAQRPGMYFSFRESRILERERERDEVDMNSDHSRSCDISRGFPGILVSASEFSNHFIQSIRSVPTGTESSRKTHIPRHVHRSRPAGSRPSRRRAPVRSTASMPDRNHLRDQGQPPFCCNMC